VGGEGEMVDIGIVSNWFGEPTRKAGVEDGADGGKAGMDGKGELRGAGTDGIIDCAARGVEGIEGMRVACIDNVVSGELEDGVGGAPDDEPPEPTLAALPCPACFFPCPGSSSSDSSGFTILKPARRPPRRRAPCGRRDGSDCDWNCDAPA
jgi:hypothetical protein